MSEIDDQLRKACESIAQELEAYFDGRAYADPDSGETYIARDGETAPDDCEQLSVMEWADDILDYRVVCRSDGEPIYAEACVALGGPTIWVDCGRCEVIGAWGTDRVSVGIPYDAAKELSDCLCETWSCR